MTLQKYNISTGDDEKKRIEKVTEIETKLLLEEIVKMKNKIRLPQEEEAKGEIMFMLNTKRGDQIEGKAEELVLEYAIMIT